MFWRSRFDNRLRLGVATAAWQHGATLLTRARRRRRRGSFLDTDALRRRVPVRLRLMRQRSYSWLEDIGIFSHVRARYRFRFRFVCWSSFTFRFWILFRRSVVITLRSLLCVSQRRDVSTCLLFVVFELEFHVTDSHGGARTRFPAFTLKNNNFIVKYAKSRVQSHVIKLQCLRHQQLLGE